jgi:hypothetical protein
MRRAFHPDTRPLTDRNKPKAEREALSHLFAGAIGSYKNPHSRRSVTIEPSEAVEMIMLAILGTALGPVLLCPTVKS